MAKIPVTKFDFWQYRDDANCWDFVAAWLKEVKGIDAGDLPKFDILPSDKRSMTRASICVARSFIESGPVDGAIAAHYHGDTLQHVGVIDGKIVRHTGSRMGTAKHPIAKFERLASKTKYYLHKSLANGIN